MISPAMIFYAKPGAGFPAPGFEEMQKIIGIFVDFFGKVCII